MSRLTREDVRFLAQEGVSRTGKLNVRYLAARLLEASEAFVEIEMVIAMGGDVAIALDRIQSIARAARLEE